MLQEPNTRRALRKLSLSALWEELFQAAVFRADVGVVVDNISTVKAISDAIQTGMPLVERVATVTGEKIKNPGTSLSRSVQA